MNRIPALLLALLCSHCHVLRMEVQPLVGNSVEAIWLLKRGRQTLK